MQAQLYFSQPRYYHIYMIQAFGRSRLRFTLGLAGVFTVLPVILCTAIPGEASADTTNELYYTEPSHGECVRGGPGSSYIIRWTVPKGILGNVSGTTFDPRAAKYAHILYSKEWGSYDKAQYIEPSSSAISAVTASSLLPWNFSTAWKPVPNITVTGTVWLRIELDQDTIRNNSNEIAWIRPWSTAVPFSIDSSPPSSPALNLASRTDTTVRVAWTASTDEGCAGLGGYRVYRNGNLMASITNGSTYYTDTNLQPGTSFTYRVTAYDNLASSDSNTLTATTTGSPPATPAPTTPAGQQSPTTIQNPPGTASSQTTSQGALQASPGKTAPSTGMTASPASTSSAGLTMVTAAALPEKSVKLERVLVEMHSIDPAQVIDNLEIKKGSILHLEGVANPAGAAIKFVINGTEAAEKTVLADAQGKWLFDYDTKKLRLGAYKIMASVSGGDGISSPEINLMNFSLFTSLPGGVSVLTRQQAPKDTPLLAFFLAASLVIISIIGITLLYFKRKSLLSSPEDSHAPTIPT